jgi:hypothetical protein
VYSLSTPHRRLKAFGISTLELSWASGIGRIEAASLQTSSPGPGTDTDVNVSHSILSDGLTISRMSSGVVSLQTLQIPGLRSSQPCFPDLNSGRITVPKFQILTINPCWLSTSLKLVPDSYGMCCSVSVSIYLLLSGQRGTVVGYVNVFYSTPAEDLACIV